jgi:hypothetical protein
LVMVRRRSFVFLVMFPALLFSRTSSGQEVTARASVDSSSYQIGDWITVRVGLTHPRGATFKVLVGDTLGPFRVLSRSALEGTSETETATTLVVAKYDSGTSVLPPIPISYTVPGDTALHTVATNPMLLTTSTLKVDTTLAIKDVKPPIPIPLTLTEILVYLGIALALILAAYFLYRYWKKRQQKKTGEAFVPPPRPAHTVALEQLALLREKKLWQQGLIKQYYSEVTEIVRRYFENRYGFMALEQTTEEIMHALGKHHHAKVVWDETERILRRADLVKFAKYQPGIREHEEMFAVALDIVDRTTAVPAAPVEVSQQKVTTDVEG